MKKLLVSSLTITILLVSFVCMSGFAAVSAKSLDKADLCFFEAMCIEADSNLSYNRQPMYDENLKQNGWQYNFFNGTSNGYALITELNINGEIVYEAEEIRYGESPFDKCLGIPVFITHKTYLDYQGNQFYDIESGEVVNQDIIDYYSDIGFGYDGGFGYIEKTQTISYASKAITEEYSIKYDLPNYYGNVGGTNCANVAGSVAIGYYDRFCMELIPGYQTYRKLGSLILYKDQSEEIVEVQNELYDLMSTDKGSNGTTFSGFQEGMKSYTESKGYSYNTNELISFGSLNMDRLKTELKAGKPIALFLSDYAILSDIVANGTNDTITSMYCDVAHVAMCCGYKIDTYYDSDGRVIDTRIYLKIVIGLHDVAKGNFGYLNMTELSTVNHAIAVSII